jgi:hypothetical protein
MILAPPSWPIHSVNEDPLWVTPEAFLFKHHPTLTNVKSSGSLWTTTPPPTGRTGSVEAAGTTSTTIAIQATQPIQRGQELFLDYHQHLHSILPTWYHSVIPTLDDYNEATEILHQARKTIRDPPGARGRNLSKQQSVVGAALRMIQHVVARYRPAAAKLIGTTLEAIAQFRGKADDVNCLELGLRNITWNSISIHGMCVHDIVPAVASTGTGSMMTTVHAVPKGQRFHPIPVLLQQRSGPDHTVNGECSLDEDDSPSSSSASSKRCTAGTVTAPSPCWSWENNRHVPFHVCPLQQSFFFNQIQRAIPTCSDCDREETSPPTTAAKRANVKLEWSSWKGVTSVMNPKWEPPAELVRIDSVCPLCHYSMTTTTTSS